MRNPCNPALQPSTPANLPNLRPLNLLWEGPPKGGLTPFGLRHTGEV